MHFYALLCFIFDYITFQLYDYGLTFEQEARLIWGQSRWSYTKFLFILCRYIPAIYAWPHIQSEHIHC